MTAVLALATEIATGRRREISFAMQTAWNWILLAVFILCSLTGLFLLFPAAVQSPFALPASYWHTETGLAFVAIGAYHAVRRFSCMVRGLKGCLARR